MLPASFPAPPQNAVEDPGNEVQCVAMVTVVFTVVLFLDSRITELCHLWTIRNCKRLITAASCVMNVMLCMLYYVTYFYINYSCTHAWQLNLHSARSPLYCSHLS